MADAYFDYLECGDYGDHAAAELQKLVGVSALVDVGGLVALIVAAVARLDVELGEVGVTRSGLRGTRADLHTEVPDAAATLGRFHSYLGSLDPAVDPFDLEAFFAGGNLGTSGRLKPADLVSRLDTVLRGFEAPQNAGLVDGPRWQARLTKARDDLAASSTARDGSSGTSIRSTAGLQEARDAFVRTYNGCAKNLVRGLLTHLGREGELRLFFKDLQVNETPK